MWTVFDPLPQPERLPAGSNTPFSADVIPLNDTVRFANTEGVIAQTAGTPNRPPGVWQICFLAEGQVVTGAVTFAVTA